VLPVTARQGKRRFFALQRVSADENFVVTTSVVCLKKRLKSSLQAQIFIY
jgi:hypothetical protein